MQSGADLRIRLPLVSFSHVTYPHFITFYNSLYTTIRNPHPNRNTAVITDPQIGPIDPQTVAVLIRPAFCHVPIFLYHWQIGVGLWRSLSKYSVKFGNKQVRKSPVIGSHRPDPIRRTYFSGSV